MPRYRRRKEPSFLDLIPPIGGLLALGIFFSPAFRQLLGALVMLVVVLSVLGVVGWLVWRFLGRATFDNSLPPVRVSTPAEETFRAAFGRVNLMEEPQRVSQAWSQELLSKLEWKRFEDVVAAYSGMLGYEAKTTRMGADGGVDVHLFQNGQPAPVAIIQCKAWNTYQVGVKPIRELYGVMAADKVANGAFFTSGDFTSEAREWAKNKNLDLVNGREFLNRIRQLTPSQHQALLAVATYGDYTTPTCPSCGVKMVIRTASKGRSEGQDFYGCRNYPRCRQTFKMSKD